ncbi:hypothetical protein B0H13DRAFT_2328978 [Mycena leptocephala]|nr:hypothetical protein B0H13DRAFT_2328978 [Mycena leptocephala]
MAMLIRTGSATASLLAYAAINWPMPSPSARTYFLRLPQIEMLVNVKYAIPGQVRPILCSDARECVLFWTEIPREPPDGTDAVEEIVLLVAASPSPSDVPMFKLEPDTVGEAPLAHILERDATVTEEEFAADAAELANLQAVGSPELLEQEGLDKHEEAHAKIRVHLEDAKEKLKALTKMDGVV